MKQKWSNQWLSSVQPRKQRKFRYNAPLHVRQRLASANLSPELRKRFSKRSMQLRKGDEIKVMRGGFRGKTGTVERVDLSKGKIYIEEIKVKKVDGSDVARAMQPSNLMITKLKLDDKKRQAILDRAGQVVKKPEPRKEEPAKEKPAEKKEEPAKKKEPGKKTKPRKQPAMKPLPKTKPAKSKASKPRAVKKKK
jgi:large subunit ribosomal protein L24